MSKQQVIVVSVIVVNIVFFGAVFLLWRAQTENAALRAKLAAVPPQFLPPAANSPPVPMTPPPGMSPEEFAEMQKQAAFRNQSKTNIKHLMLALHNYLAANTAFPVGTHPNPDLSPEQRISWIAAVLPYVDQPGAFNQINFKSAWNDPINAPVAKMKLDVLLTPGATGPESQKEGLSQYVGIAGVGEDAPLLPVADPRAGVFGYDRKTTLADIKDGTSMTISITEARKDLGPWMAGGRSTIRPLTKAPYVNGPDGLGGPYKGGMHVGLTDGSVRFISENIDPKVLEALSTINGGEAIPAF